MLLLFLIHFLFNYSIKLELINIKDEPDYHSDRIPSDVLVDFKLNVTITGTTPSTVLVKLHGELD